MYHSIRHTHPRPLIFHISHQSLVLHSLCRWRYLYVCSHPAPPASSLQLLTPTVEVIGYIGRAIGHDDSESRGPYIIQYLFILLAPALFAASIYMVLGRIIIATHAQNLSVVRVRWQTMLFVSGDVLSFLVQCIGGGILASGDDKDESKRDLGKAVILTGIWIQIVFLRMREFLIPVSSHEKFPRLTCCGIVSLLLPQFSTTASAETPRGNRRTLRYAGKDCCSCCTPSASSFSFDAYTAL